VKAVILDGSHVGEPLSVTRQIIADELTRLGWLVELFPLCEMEIRPFSQQAKDAMSRPLVPAWAYVWLGDLGWKRQARHYGTQKRLHARPYEPS